MVIVLVRIKKTEHGPGFSKEGNEGKIFERISDTHWTYNGYSESRYTNAEIESDLKNEFLEIIE